MKTIKVNDIDIGNHKPFVLIAGLNVLEDVGEILIILNACIGSSREPLHVIVYAVELTVVQRIGVVCGEAVGQGGFANFHVVVRGRQDDVRGDALLLGGATGDTVEF